jgi:hypothetical protein
MQLTHPPSFRMEEGLKIAFTLFLYKRAIFPHYGEAQSESPQLSLTGMGCV